MSIISGLIPTQAWIKDYLSDPYWEGAERIKRGISGKNRHLLSQPKLSVREQIVSLALGFLLILPLINTIVWIAMQVFSNPEFLSPPYVYRPTPEPRPALELKRPQARRSPSPIEAKPMFEKKEMKVLSHERVAFEHLGHSETLQNSENLSRATQATEPIKGSFLPRQVSYIDEKEGKKEKGLWSFETRNEELFALAEAPSARTESHYKSGLIQKYHYISKSKKGGELQLTLKGTTLHLEAERESEIRKKTQRLVQTFDLGNKPWIQQTTLGFRNFVQSKHEQTLEFYGVHPEEFTLTSLTAKKRKIEQLPVHGTALHIQIFICSFIPVVNAWFNPENGLLIKSSAATGLFSRITTELTAENLSSLRNPIL